MKKLVAIILVNLLTTVRIVGVFLLVPIYLNHGGLYAAILSIGCYLTDFLDGIIARKCHVATFFGSVFDGFADKAFSCANLLVLLSITKFAIIPILFELAIVIIQTIKFNKNVNVQSSLMGKAKTWIISLTVIALYLITDINKLTFLPSSFINFINNTDKVYLYGVMFIPLYIFEFLTLISYLKFLKNYNPNEVKKVPEIEKYFKKPKTFKDSFDNFCTFWLSNEFYEKFKDIDTLKELKRQSKKYQHR